MDILVLWRAYPENEHVNRTLNLNFLPYPNSLRLQDTAYLRPLFPTDMGVVLDSKSDLRFALPQSKPKLQ